MRKILALAALLFFHAATSMAQDEKMNPAAAATPIMKPSRDFVMLQFLYTNWTVRPDTVDVKAFSYGFNGYLCYDFPIKKTRLSFAAGLGINTTTTYLDKQRITFTDTGALGNQARFVPDTAGYKKYKFNTTYLQAPFELRYFGNTANRNKGFKAAIGLQVGTLLGAHTKGLRSVSGTNVKEKIDTKRYVSNWNFAATARIGFGNFSLFGSYNITNVFKDNSGPPLTPMSIGLCLTGL